jgi:hypothetical protein
MRERFQVLMAVKMSLLVFWIVMLCGLVGRNQHLENIFSALKMESVCSSETLVSIYSYMST